MATLFDATFFDSLSDNVLKSLRYISILVQATNGHVDNKLFASLAKDLNGYPFADFCEEVNEAFERRYGEVPGM